MRFVIFNDIGGQKTLQGLGSLILLRSPYPESQPPQSPLAPSLAWGGGGHTLPLPLAAGELPDRDFFPTTVALKPGWQLKAASLSTHRWL